jgi:hypothetical protein
MEILMQVIDQIRTGPAPAILHEKAQALEALLFAQMLGAAGTGMRSTGDGPESPFAGLLRQAQAEAVAGAGQTGLADAIARSLMRNLRR